MASEDMGLLQAHQRLHNGVNHHHHHPRVVFPDNTFSCRPADAPAVADHTSKSAIRVLTGGFIDHQHYFHQPPPDGFRRAMFSSAAESSGPHHRENSNNWNLSSRATSGGDGSQDDGDVEDDDDEEHEVGRLVDNNDEFNNNTSTNREKIGSEKLKPLSSFGMKEGNVVGRCGNENNSNSEMRNAVTIADADGEMYYSQYPQGKTEVGLNAAQKDSMVVDNVCGFSGRKEGVFLSESGESLREILSDPLTGALMDDAMILPCGHSFGSGGIQHVLRMQSCCTCSQMVSEDSVSPNLSLRMAVQTFRREEELQIHRASKRRREWHEQDKGTFGDLVHKDHARGRGVQFPFVVTDRVIIKGNKRTPPRFVGREAIVTTQCLNGWYVVKTLDNAESVKLQYRSLAKVPDKQSPKPMSSKMTPNWL